MCNQYDTSRIGKRIRNERKKAGYKSAQSFAEFLNIGRSQLEQIERGERMPDVGLFVKMCSVFGCDMGYLLCEYDARTHETADIANVCGITLNAAEKLAQNHSCGLIRFPALSYILESNDFWILLDVMESYRNVDFKKQEYAASMARAFVSSVIPSPSKSITNTIGNALFSEICANRFRALVETYRKESQNEKNY